MAILKNTVKWIQKRNKLDIFSIMPLTFSFDLADANLMRDLQEFAKYFNYTKLIWRLFEKGAIDSVSNMTPEELLRESQKVMTDCMKGKRRGSGEEMVKFQEKKQFEWLDLETARQISEAFRTSNFSIDNFTQDMKKIKLDDPFKINYLTHSLPESLCAGKGMWISKVGGLNRGLGIEIFTNIDQLKGIIGNLARGYQELLVQNNVKVSRSKIVIKANKFVIQKYIEKPLLFANKKMDIRVWVLLTPDLRPHVFRECYFRLSSEQFGMDGCNEKFVHLTNNALQKFSPNFEADETLKSIEDFDQFINSEIRENYQFRRDTYPRIKELVTMVGQVAKERINFNNKKLTFEIFGFDFMLDVNFGVWLIEINSNPSITTPGKILKAYVPRMLDDAMKLTIDRIFPAPAGAQQTETYPIEGYDDNDNLWEPLGG